MSGTAFNIKDLASFLPELGLAATILLLCFGEIVLGKNPRKRSTLALVAIAGLLLSGWLLTSMGQAPLRIIFSGQLAIDPFGQFFKGLFILMTLVTVLTSYWSKELPTETIGEYFMLLISIAFGMCLMATATNLVILYLGVEMVSIVSFAMAGFRHHDKRSSEAALKYVVYGGAASGVMLFGISMFYGMFGSTDLGVINQGIVTFGQQLTSQSFAARSMIFPVTFFTSLLFIFAGIGYKIAVVPFHMWSPDVYEGAPTPFTAFLSVGPKAAGFALLIRFIFQGLIGTGPDASRGFLTDAHGMAHMTFDTPFIVTLGIIAAISMTVGNLAAIPQNNVKRMLAYSSIAHAGYLMVGVVVLSTSALHAVVLYLVFYYLMNFGAFTVCQAVRDSTGGEMLQHFRGLGSRSPLLAATMTVFLLSLTGLPPLAGFVGKFYLFASVIERGGFWYLILVLVGVTNSAISLFYYLKVVKAMYLTDATEKTALRVHRGYVAMTTGLAILTLIGGLYWAPLSQDIDKSLVMVRPQHNTEKVATLPTPTTLKAQ